LSKNEVLTNPIYGLSSFSRSWGSWGVYAIFSHTQTLLLICSGLQKGKLPLPLLRWCFNGLSFFAWIRAISGDYGMQHQEVPFGVPKLVLFWHADVRCKNLYRLSLCRRRCHLPASRSSQLRVVCWRRSIPGYRTSWWMVTMVTTICRQCAIPSIQTHLEEHVVFNDRLIWPSYLKYVGLLGQIRTSTRML
jgi:hypothetical protein